MCNFFSFCTMPDSTSDFYYFDWQMRQADKAGADSHSHICARFGIDEDTMKFYDGAYLDTKTSTNVMEGE